MIKEHIIKNIGNQTFTKVLYKSCQSKETDDWSKKYFTYTYWSIRYSRVPLKYICSFPIANWQLVTAYCFPATFL